MTTMTETQDTTADGMTSYLMMEGVDIVHLPSLHLHLIHHNHNVNTMSLS
mgnify:FL=1